MSEFKASDKVWVYTSPQKFSQEQKDTILSSAQHFLNSWESHGDKVKGEIGIAYDHFVIIIADDCGGSMCGRAQDAQMRFIKEVGEEIGQDLTDRMQLAYKVAEDAVAVKPMPAFKAEIANGGINGDTVVFNNMVTTYGEFGDKWEVPLVESWHKQLLG
jgi:hypothetical protein